MFVANWTLTDALEGSSTSTSLSASSVVTQEAGKLSRETPEGRISVLPASKYCLLICLLNRYCWHEPVICVSQSPDYWFKSDYLLHWRILQQWFFSPALESVLNFGFRHKNIWLGSDAVHRFLLTHRLWITLWTCAWHQTDFIHSVLVCSGLHDKTISHSNFCLCFSLTCSWSLLKLSYWYRC